MRHFETTILRLSGVDPANDLTAGLASAATDRATIFEMSQAAEDAVLRPLECGAFAHDLRAALAARVARQAGEDALADRYAADAGARAVLADPGAGDADLAEVLKFTDRVANHTRDIGAADVLDLQGAGICDADIVRLCELVAFLAYQIRVTAGLRLMRGALHEPRYP